MNATGGRIVLLAVSSALYALLFASLAGALLRRRRSGQRITTCPEPAESAALLLYVLLSFLWTLGQLLLALKYPGPLPYDLLPSLVLYAPIPLSLLFLQLTCQFLARGSVHHRPAGPGTVPRARRGGLPRARRGGLPRARRGGLPRAQRGGLPRAQRGGLPRAQRGGLAWPWWILGLAWLAAVMIINEDLLAGVGLSLHGTMPALTRQWVAFIALVLGWGFFMAVAAIRTLRAYAQSSEPTYRARIKYWVLVLCLTTAGVVLFLMGYRDWGSLIGLTGCCSAAYLLMTYHLPDIRRLIREALSHLVIALLLVTFCTGGFLIGYYALQAVPGYPPWIIGGALALLLAFVIHPLLDRMKSLMARQSPSGAGDASRILAEFVTLISNIRDPEELSIVALGLVREAMETGHGAVFVVRDQESAVGDMEARPLDQAESLYLHCLASSGSGLGSIPLRAEGSMVEYLSQEERPLTQEDLGLQPRFYRMTLQERQTLSDLGMELYAPIHAEGTWIGLLALGPRRTGGCYTEAELELLGMLAGQLGVALQNARRFDTVRARLARRDLRNEELRAARQDLIHLVEGQSGFMRLAAREMQPPLGGLQGYVEVLREMVKAGSLTTERGEEMMQGISSSALRLEEMTQTLASAAAVETGSLSLELQPVQVEATVRAARDRWSAALEARGLTFSTWKLELLPAILADPLRLEQVFAELIQNSIKFTPDGGQIQVRGALREESHAVRVVEVVVADTGVGIATGRDPAGSDLVRVFEPFYRRGEVVLHAAGQTRFGVAGPGLGLSRVRAIVDAHGGRVWVKSPGYDKANCPGTEVHVVLPVRPSPESSEGTGPESSTGAGP